jgi:hypothetical protein
MTFTDGADHREAKSKASSRRRYLKASLVFVMFNSLICWAVVLPLLAMSNYRLKKEGAILLG